MKTVMIEVRVSDWANWMAQDEEGEWYLYESKPDADIQCWMSSDGFDDLIAKGPPNENWRDTLRKV